MRGSEPKWLYVSYISPARRLTNVGTPDYDNGREGHMHAVYRTRRLSLTVDVW